MIFLFYKSITFIFHVNNIIFQWHICTPQNFAQKQKKNALIRDIKYMIHIKLHTVKKQTFKNWHQNKQLLVNWSHTDGLDQEHTKDTAKASKIPSYLLEAA